MKKYLLLAVSALIFAFTSCSDKVEIDLKYQTNISVSVDKLMAPFHEMIDGNFDIFDGLQIRIHSLVYDGNGDLVQSFVSGVNNYSNVSVFSLALNPGKYKVVSIADFVVGSVDSPSLNWWNIEGKENLGNLSIAHSDLLLEIAHETLGTASDEFEVDNTAQEIKVSIKPATALVQIVFDYRDTYTGDGNGVSQMALVCQELEFFTETGAYVMTGFDENITYKPRNSQEYVYYIKTDNPFETIEEGYKMDGGYRAFLPQRIKDIFMELTIVNLEDGSTEDMEVSFKNVNLTFEAGKQYELYFEFDSGRLYYEGLNDFQQTKSIHPGAAKNMELKKKLLPLENLTTNNL